MNATIDRPAGFSMIELMLAVAMVSIVAIGLTSLIEIPRQVVERKNEGLGIEVADRSIGILDRDIRFCQSVTSLSPTEIVVHTNSGDITYAWSGTPGDALTRTEGGTSSSILERVTTLRFTLGGSPLPGVRPPSVTESTRAIDCASFSSFASAGIGAAATSQVHAITKDERFGISFVADLSASSTGRGDASAVTLRLRRSGTRDVRVTLYQAAAPSNPSSGIIAVGQFRNAKIPTYFSDVTIPLTSSQKLLDGTMYFIDVSSQQSGASAEIEYDQLERPNQVSSLSCGVSRSTDSGRNYTPVSTVIGTAQTPFTVEATASVVHDVSGAPQETVITSVTVKLKVRTANGDEPLIASFPLTNNIARLTR